LALRGTKEDVITAMESGSFACFLRELWVCRDRSGLCNGGVIKRRPCGAHLLLTLWPRHRAAWPLSVKLRCIWLSLFSDLLTTLTIKLVLLYFFFCFVSMFEMICYQEFFSTTSLSVF